jgi:diguanylate cyclase (GGDEF)-like protein
MPRSAGVEPSSSPVPGKGSPRVLVVEGDADLRAQLEQQAHEKLVDVIALATPEEALALARGLPPGERVDAAILDGSLGSYAAVALGRDLHALPGMDRLPLAFLLEPGDVELRVAAARAGAAVFLVKPVDPYAFGAAVDQMLAINQADAETMSVLVVDDDPEFAACIAAVLEPHGIAVRTEPDATRLIEALDDVRPDLILLDAVLPGVSGWDAIRIVRAIPEWRDVPVLFLTGRTDLESRIAAFDAGADDYLAKPLVPEELLARVRVRLDRRRLLRETTERDPLTRCLSRRAVLGRLASRLSEARRHARVISVALVDLDRFKRINDTYGHLVGDQVLMALGRLFNDRFRLEDLRGRWGGEEFVLAFPDESAETAARVLSRVLDEFRVMPFRPYVDAGQDRTDAGDERFFVTFSAGLASFPADGLDVDALIRAADRRLYGAKRSGRAQVVADETVVS